jgi:sulfatase maturation enzyme AslB (radical SAM superfamily)
MQDKIHRLHLIFMRLLRERPDCVSWNGANLCDSGPFCAAARAEVAGLAALCSREELIGKVGAAMRESNILSAAHIFTGALFAALAERAMAEGDPAVALRLAEEALAYSQFDLFAQDIVLRAEHALNPALPGPEATTAWLKTRFCLSPFTTLETTTSGEFYCCCPAYVPRPIGKIGQGDVRNLLHMDAAKDIQGAILDGSFRYCSKMHCPWITGRNLMSREEGLAAIKALDGAPKDVTFSHDDSCNLYCPSCRKARHVLPKDEQERLDAFSKTVLKPLMMQAQSVNICGSGDPFASIHFRNLLVAYCKEELAGARKLILQTNGVLLDARAWKEVGLEGHVKEVWISIDAAGEATYRVLRCGGDFARLHENLRFLAALRREGRFDFLMTRFVVQQRNFREMPAFIRQGREIGVDCVQFSRLRNWGTFPPAVYARHNVIAREHAEHDALLSVLRDPLFDDPIVGRGNIADLRAEALAQAGARDA